MEHDTLPFLVARLALELVVLEEVESLSADFMDALNGKSSSCSWLASESGEKLPKSSTTLSVFLSTSF
jgi:hypothetical protein